MATHERIMVDLDKVIVSVEKSLNRIAEQRGLVPVFIPTHSKYGKPVLQVEQLQAVVAWLDTLASDSAPYVIADESILLDIDEE